MENLVLATAGIFLNKKKIRLLFLLLMSGFLFAGCASSNVSRSVTSNIDMGVNNAKNLADGSPDSTFSDSYQNASQTTKGAIIGGAAGAVTGAVSSGIGIIPGTAAGMIMGASYGSYIDANTTLVDKLENRGAVVVVLGDQVLVILPSARIFNPMTANIKTQAYSTLNLVAQFINSFNKMLVKVAAYTSQLGSAEVNLALSQQQAKNVAKFFTAAGVDARVLFAEGYGATHFVERNTRSWGESDNYRVEITLEKIDS